MPAITTRDGVEIFYKDWGPRNAQPLVFHHGWPLSADDWDTQLLYFLDKGYRVVAHDRRGHGRSSQVSDGHDMDHYAADVAAVVEHLDLRNAVHIGHSTGGGEATRYVARHGNGRVAKLVLIGAVPPIMLKTAANPEGLPIEVFDAIRAGVAGDRSQFYKDLAIQFYGANREGAKVSQGTLDQFWLWSMQAGAKNAYESVKAFSETDFTEDGSVSIHATLGRRSAQRVGSRLFGEEVADAVPAVRIGSVSVRNERRGAIAGFAAGRAARSSTSAPAPC